MKTIVRQKWTKIDKIKKRRNISTENDKFRGAVCRGGKGKAEA